MEGFWQFMKSSGFLLTVFGAFVGYISWKGSKDTNNYINEGHLRLEKFLEEGDKRLEKSLEEGNKRLENILQAMQLRWDQSDEFNKRMLDKILDRVA